MRLAGAGVLVLGATNRPEQLDHALLRPGRFDVQLYVPPPDHAGRLAALRVHCRDLPLEDSVDLGRVAAATDGFTGKHMRNRLDVMFALPSDCRSGCSAPLRCRE